MGDPVEVLFVCTGNLCRSPMAEVLLRHELEVRGCADVAVRSVGTWAGDGNPASDGAIAVLQGRGLDLSPHRSRALVAEDLRGADVIVVMTSVHLREVLALDPGAAPKLFLVKEIAELEDGPSGAQPATSDAATPRARLDQMLAARRPAPRRSLDVDDPIGLPLSAYERCVDEVHTGVAALAGRLCG